MSSTSQIRFNIPVEFTVNMADIAETPDYLSVPVVFTKEGVHNGVLKTYESIKKHATELVGKPVVIGHPFPKRPVNSRDPVTGEIESCFARDSDKALHGRIKIVKSKTPAWLLESIKAGRLRGGSVGYYSTVTPFGGYYQGSPYSGVETVSRDSVTGDIWDHYAIGLEDGAASIKDGCGLRFNSKEEVDDLPSMNKLKTFFGEKITELTELISSKKSNQGEKTNLSTSDEKENKLIEKLGRQIEELTVKNREWETKYNDANKLKGDAESKVKGYEDAKAAEVTTKHDVLVKELIEDTDDKAEQYKDWSVTQLETLKTKLTPKQEFTVPTPQAVPGRADSKALKPPTSDSVVQPLSIGNSLFGKKMNEV